MTIRSIAAGFTLFEIMLVIAIIGVLTALLIPVYSSFQTRNTLDIAQNTVIQVAHRAQTLAQASENDSAWGVRILPGSVTLFQGDSYATRNQANDEVSAIGPTVTATGLTELVFTAFSGLPQSAGIITLTNYGDSTSISINARGVLSY